MAYNVRNSKGEIFVTVEDGKKDDTTTSVVFIGKRYVDFGLIQNQNALQMLEHFSASIPPLQPVIGQLWYDSTPGVEILKVFTSETIGWRALGYTNTLTDSVVNDNIIFTGETTFSNEATFNNITEFNSVISLTSIIVADSTTVNGGDMVFEVPVVFSDTTTFAGSTVFSGSLSITAPVAFDSTMQVNDTFTAQAQAVFLGPIDMSAKLTCDDISAEDIVGFNLSGLTQTISGLTQTSTLDVSSIATVNTLIVSASTTLDSVIVTAFIETSTQINVQTGTAYTAAISDRNGIITMNNGAGNVFTLDPVGTTNYPVGQVMEVIQLGAGATTITAGAAVDLNGVTAGSGIITAQNDVVKIRHVATDVWIMNGDHGAVA